MHIAVAGAHLSGQPLNRQLTSRGATLVATTQTAPVYRLYALKTEPAKPGLVRVGDDEGAGAVEVEVWDLDPTSFAVFVDEIPKTAVGKFRKTALRERFAKRPEATHAS